MMKPLIARNYEELCRITVSKILSMARKAIKAQGYFRVGLCGGETPKGIYALMASPAYQQQFEWPYIEFFLEDERWVPLEDARSNYRMITSAFTTRNGIPLTRIHGIKTHLPDAQTAASLYEQELMKSFNQIDLMLLGVGADGHTASLFPNHPVLEEKKRWVAVVESPNVPEKRVTITLPVINNAKTVFFIASGPAKAQVIRTVFSKINQGALLPVQRVEPRGKVSWFLDQQAAQLI
jgi:6-phosphogluconolactonase